MELIEKYIYDNIKAISNTTIIDNPHIFKEICPNLANYGIQKREAGQYSKEELKEIQNVYKNFIFMKKEDLTNVDEMKFNTVYASVNIVTVDKNGNIEIKKIDSTTKNLQSETKLYRVAENYVIEENHFHQYHYPKLSEKIVEGIYNKSVLNSDGDLLSKGRVCEKNGIVSVKDNMDINRENNTLKITHTNMLAPDDYYEYTAFVPYTEDNVLLKYCCDVKELYREQIPVKVSNAKRNIFNEDLTIKNMNPNDILSILYGGNPGAANIIRTVYAKNPEQFANYMYILEKNNIIGDKIYLLYNDVCSNNFETFIEIIRGLSNGTISNELLSDKLSQVYPGSDTSFIKK